MPRPKRLTLTLQTPSITNFMADQQITAAGELALDGTLTSSGTLSLPTAQKIDFESAGNLGGVTLTITGTTELGAAATETLTAPATSTVTSAKYWKTISSVASDGSIGTNMSAGISDEAKSQTVPLNRYNNYGIGIAVNIDGTINYTMNESSVNPQSGNTMNWIAISALASKTADLQTTLTNPNEAVQVVVNSYSSGATIVADIIQR